MMRHPITGRYMAGDCERDCLEHCAGLCGAVDERFDLGTLVPHGALGQMMGLRADTLEPPTFDRFRVNVE